MATRSLPPHPDLDHLRRQARALRRAAVAGDPQAAARIARDHPDPPADLTTFRLSAAQLTVAREYGFASWPRLRHHVEARAAHSWTPTDADGSVAAQFCRLACLTYAGDDGPDRRTAARALLDAHPELVDGDIWAAAAASRADVVAHLLGGDASLARRRGGPHGWRPLAYLAYSRVGGADRGADPVTTARLLLDAGADPDEGYLWHGEPTLFTLLTGVFGEGEGGPVNQPRHAESIALARLLLDRGAEPNDGQTLYNRMFGTDDDHLVLLFEYGLGRGDGGVWRRRLGPEAVDEPQTLVRDLLRWAVQHGQLARVRLLADHGVDLHSPFGDGAWPTGGRSATPAPTPLSLAAASGDPAMVDLLVSLGAEPADMPPVDAFVEAAMLGDRDRVAALGDAVAAQARDERPGLIVWAAARGRHDTVALLVDRGFDVNAYGRQDVPVEERWETALHAAVSLGDPDLVRILLRLGADPALRDVRFGATPLEWAHHLDRTSLVALLDGE